MVDLAGVSARLEAIEARSLAATVSKPAVVHELDRLAEHLVGESSPEVPTIKAHIQALINQMAPERASVTAMYVEIYCGGGARL
jgi:hypothetical protein